MAHGTSRADHRACFRGFLGMAVIGLGAALACAGSGWAAPAAARGVLVSFYSVPKLQGFVDNADDRSRGEGNNPFGHLFAGFVAPPVVESKYGPFPGDEGMFTFDVYTNASAKTRVGSAVFICQYNFDKNGFCDAFYDVSGGMLTGAGPVAAGATSFNLAVTGGTSRYRGATGELIASAAPGARPVTAITRPVLMLTPQDLAFSVRLPTSPSQHSTFYSLTTQQQFIDNGDDEVRGFSNNPFGIRNKPLEAAENEDKLGPFPGDESFFEFKVYSASALKKSLGTGVYPCQYYFDHNAFCDATYTFAAGSLLAAGAF